MTTATTEAMAQAIRTEFRRRMIEEYVPRIEACTARLSTEEVWSRPNAQCNSVGNLLLHLAGNVRQWILCGVRRGASGGG